MSKKKARTKGVKTHAFSTPRRLSVRGKNPNNEYRWVRNDDDSVGLREQVGWEVTTDEKIKAAGKSGASTRSTHDLVLMEIPKSQHIELKKIPGRRSKMKIKGSFAEGGEVGYEEKNSIRVEKEEKPLQNDQIDDTIFE